MATIIAASPTKILLDTFFRAIICITNKKNCLLNPNRDESRFKLILSSFYL